MIAFMCWHDAAAPIPQGATTQTCKINLLTVLSWIDNLLAKWLARMICNLENLWFKATLYLGFNILLH